MKKLSLVLFIIVVALHANAQSLNVGEYLDNINLRTSTGQPYDLKAQENTKGFIVVFMTPTCDNCLAYMQRIVALNNKYAKRGYPVIAISAYSDDPFNYPLDVPAAINKWVETNKINFPFLVDEKFKYTTLLGIKDIPEVVLLKKTPKGFEIRYVGTIDNDPNEKNKTVTKFAEQALRKL